MTQSPTQQAPASKQPDDAEKPLADSLLGDAQSGGRAGQGGMVDPAIDAEDDDQADD